MKAHKRYQTQSKLSAACVPRFNERFCKILQTCPRVIALDEDLNVVDISPLSKKIMELKENAKSDDGRLRELQTELSKCEDPVKSALTKKAVTYDQCNLLAKIMDLFNGVELDDSGEPVAEAGTKNPAEGAENEAETLENAQENAEDAEELSEDSNAGDNEADAAKSTENQVLKDYKAKEQRLEERKLKMLKKRHEKAYNNLMNELNQQKKKPEEPEPTTLFPNNKQIFIKAARGRGKSALLGLAISAAIAKQATNILLFAPKVENIQTVFQFIEVGLKQLGYLEHQDYKIIKEDAKRQLANITGIDIMRTHR